MKRVLIGGFLSLIGSIWAMASLSPSTSTSAPLRRNFSTTLSSALTAVMSQKWRA